jgi:hypothetical protein
MQNAMVIALHAAELVSDLTVEPRISQPIDKGAAELLRPHENAYHTYPPNEVDYLIRTLNDHLYNCLELRQKAQDLEVRIFAEANEHSLQKKLLEICKRQAELVAMYEPKLLGNKVDARLNGGVVEGTDSAYWAEVLATQKEQIEAREKDAELKLRRLAEEGSGANFGTRFEFLKKLFDVDLVEAYCRARAAALGLREFHGLDHPVPAVTDVGYLDKLVLWARGVTYEFEKQLFNVREATVAFNLHDAGTGEDVPRLMTADAFRAARGAGTFAFELKAEYFRRPCLQMKNPRLRAVDAFVWNAANTAINHWRVRIDPPELRIPLGAGGTNWTRKPQVLVPMATYPSRLAEIEMPNQREVHNVNPIGEWTIRIEPKSIFGQNTNDNGQVDNVLLRLRIAYEAP